MDEKPRPFHAYEITWTSGHVETVHAQQVTWPGNAARLFAEVDVQTTERVVFYGEIDGRWTLLLSARVEDIRTIRNKVTEQYVDGA